MKTPFENLSGQKFGRLTVDNLVRFTKQNKAIYAVTCECGNKREVYAQHLRSGRTLSCGCWRDQAPSYRATAIATPERWQHEHVRVTTDIAELRRRLSKKLLRLEWLNATKDHFFTDKDAAA